MTNELPGEWGRLLAPKGIHSYRDLAKRTGISHGTAHRLVTGGRTSAETVNKVADALMGGNRDLVWRLRGSNLTDHGDWHLPAEASLLTEGQREAIRAVVKAMVPAEERVHIPAAIVETDASLELIASGATALALALGLPDQVAEIEDAMDPGLPLQVRRETVTAIGERLRRMSVESRRRQSAEHEDVG